MGVDDSIQELDVEIFVVVVVDLDHRGLPAGRETFGLEQREFAVGARVTHRAAELLLEVFLNRFAPAKIAGKCAADPDDVLANRLVEEHRIEGHDAFDNRGREPEALRDVFDDLRADPAVLSLAEPENGQERRSTLGIAGQNLVDLLFAFPRKRKNHDRAPGR